MQSAQPNHLNRYARIKQRGVALLMAIFFMVAVFFLTIAFLKILPVQSNYAYQNYQRQQASMVAEAGVEHALEKLKNGDTSNTTSSLDHGWSYETSVSTPSGAPPNTYVIESLAKLNNNPVLKVTAYVEGNDLFTKMINAGHKIDLQLDYKTGADNNSQFTGPVASNDQTQIKVGPNYTLPNPGPLFTRPITAVTTASNSIVTGGGKPTTPSEWDRFIAGGSASVYKTSDTIPLLEFNDSSSNVIDGSSNPNSLYNQVLGGSSPPPGDIGAYAGGVYINTKIDQMKFSYDSVASQAKVELWKHGNTTTTPDYTIVYDEGANTTTINDSGGAPITAAVGPSTTSGLTNERIIYGADDIKYIHGVFKGKYTIASATKIDVSSKGKSIPVLDSLIPYDSTGTFTPGDPNPSKQNGISLVAKNRVTVRPFHGGSHAGGGGSYYLYANLLGNDVELLSYDRNGDNIVVYGSIMAQHDAKFNVHGHGGGSAGHGSGSHGDPGADGTGGGDFSILWDLNNLSVVGLGGADYKLIHYEQSVH